MKEHLESQPILRAIAGAADKPLRIGDVEIPCYVLENEQRVITQNGLYNALGKAKRGGAKGGVVLDHFLGQARFNGLITNELRAVTIPIKFLIGGKREAYGYDAAILVDICKMLIAAERAGVLQRQQEHLGPRAAHLLGAFAKTGIIALVDEATGYQERRQKNALQKILEAYVNTEFLPWTRQFPIEFYQEIFRLKGWEFNPPQVKKPSVIARYTDWIVYKRLPPGVLDELRKNNPMTEAGHRKHKHHQFLTLDIGNPHLRNQLMVAQAFMRAASNWRTFVASYNRAYPLPEGLFADPDAEV